MGADVEPQTIPSALLEHFNEAFYLERYPDVARAVSSGAVSSGLAHYIAHGWKESREGWPASANIDVSSKLWIANSGDENRFGRHPDPIKFRSISELNSLIIRNLPRFSSTTDLVVGVPRSGLLAANIMALHLNKPLVTLDEFLKNNVGPSVFTHRLREGISAKHSKPRATIIDDSIGTGQTFYKIVDAIERGGLGDKYEISFLAIYSTPGMRDRCDFLEVLDHPRVFEWNFLHHDFALSYCVDMDGILCEDPRVDENDDGPLYVDFLARAKSLVLPSKGVGAVVTSRLERYRAATEDWLGRHGINYQRLVMLDLPSGAERRRLKAHAKFKSDVYRTLGGRLFVESDIGQAREIFALTGSPVFCPAASLFLSR